MNFLQIFDYDLNRVVARPRASDPGRRAPRIGKLGYGGVGLGFRFGR